MTPKARYAMLDRRCNRLVLTMLTLAILNSAWNAVPWHWGRQWLTLGTLSAQLVLLACVLRVVRRRTAAREEMDRA